jgi:hypothetical protein
MSNPRYRRRDQRILVHNETWDDALNRDGVIPRQGTMEGSPASVSTHDFCEPLMT